MNTNLTEFNIIRSKSLLPLAPPNLTAPILGRLEALYFPGPGTIRKRTKERTSRKEKKKKLHVTKIRIKNKQLE